MVLIHDEKAVLITRHHDHTHHVQLDPTMTKMLSLNVMQESKYIQKEATYKCDAQKGYIGRGYARKGYLPKLSRTRLHVKDLHLRATCQCHAEKFGQ